MSDNASLGDGSFRSTVIGGAPRVWQRILVSKHADAMDRLSLSQTCSAARSIVLQHSPRFKVTISLGHLHKATSEAQHRRLRVVQQSIRIRDQEGTSIVIKSKQGNTPADALQHLSDCSQHVHTLHLECSDLSLPVTTAAAQTFWHLRRLVISERLGGMANAFLEYMLTEARKKSGSSRKVQPMGGASLPPVDLLPQLRDLTIYEDLHSLAGDLKVTGLPPYRQQLDSLALYDLQPHNPALTVLTHPATLLRRLRIHRLTDDWVKVLLQHAPVLEHITAEEFGLERSHAAARCNWQQVTFNTHQDVTDYIKLPRRRAGRLAVHLDEAAKPQMFVVHDPFGVLDLSVSHSPTAPAMLLQRVQQDIVITGVKSICLRPSTGLRQRPASQQATTIQRYLPVLAALWQPAYSMWWGEWDLTPEVLCALLRAAVRVQARSISINQCSTRSLGLSTFRLPANFPPLPVQAVMCHHLTDDLVTLIVQHMPGVRGVMFRTSGLTGATTTVQSNWEEVLLIQSVCLQQLMWLPSPPIGKSLWVECQLGVELSYLPQAVHELAERLPGFAARARLDTGMYMTVTPPQGLALEHQPAVLRINLQLAALLPPPASKGGLFLKGWCLSTDVIAELQHLPQWPEDGSNDSGSGSADAPTSDSGKVVAAESTSDSRKVVAAESTSDSRKVVAAESTSDSRKVVAAESTGGSGEVAAESTGGSGEVAAESTGGSGDVAAAESTGGSGAVAAESTGGSGEVAAESTGGSGEVAAEPTGGFEVQEELRSWGQINFDEACAATGPGPMHLSFRDVKWPEDLSLCQQLVETVPLHYTGWVLYGKGGVTEALVKAICEAALTVRSPAHPLHLLLVWDNAKVSWIRSMREYIRKQGGSGYVWLSAKEHLVMKMPHHAEK